MNYNSLIYYALSFSAVVKAGGFSKAAKNSSVSKAQLSRHLSALEALLGIPLLHRTTRSITLTEQGRQFFTACEGIQENCAEAVNQLKQNFSGMQGTLKITAPLAFGAQFLTPIIHAFSQQYPNMNVCLSLSSIHENLTEQNFDLAIRIANHLPDSNLRMRSLLKFKRLICASPKYFKDKEMPTHPQELKNYHCITSLNRNINTLYPQWPFQIKGKLVNYKLTKYIEVDSLFAQLELVKLGTGIGRMPDYFVQNELKKGTLIELFSEIEKPDSYAYLLYPDTKALPRKTQIFMDFLKNQMK